MKSSKKYLLVFALLYAFCTLIFRATLSYSLEHHLYYLIWVASAVYFILLFSIGWILGKAYSFQRIKNDFGLFFHISSYLSVIITTEMWFIFGHPATNETIKHVNYMALYWGILLFIHIVIYFILKRKTIRGISKSEIFD